MRSLRSRLSALLALGLFVVTAIAGLGVVFERWQEDQSSLRDDVEFATMTYVDWFNHRRVHSAITDDASYTTPAEHEANFYNQPQAPKQVAQSTRNSSHQTRGDSS